MISYFHKVLMLCHVFKSKQLLQYYLPLYYSHDQNSWPNLHSPLHSFPIQWSKFKIQRESLSVYNPTSLSFSLMNIKAYMSTLLLIYGTYSLSLSLWETSLLLHIMLFLRHFPNIVHMFLWIHSFSPVHQSLHVFFWLKPSLSFSIAVLTL